MSPYMLVLGDAVFGVEYSKFLKFSLQSFKELQLPIDFSYLRIPLIPDIPRDKKSLCQESSLRAHHCPFQLPHEEEWPQALVPRDLHVVLNPLRWMSLFEVYLLILPRC